VKKIIKYQRNLDALCGDARRRSNGAARIAAGGVSIKAISIENKRGNASLLRL